MRFEITENVEAAWFWVESASTQPIQLGQASRVVHAVPVDWFQNKSGSPGILGANGAALRVPFPRGSVEALNLSDGIYVFVLAQLAASYECLW